jgi:hypothetical protein
MPWRATPRVPEFLRGGTRCPQRVDSCGSAAWFFPLQRSSCAWGRTGIVLRTRRSTLLGRPASLLSNAATPQRRRHRKSRPGVAFVDCQFGWEIAGMSGASPLVEGERIKVRGLTPERNLVPKPDPPPPPLPNPLLCPHWRWRVRLSHREREGRGDPYARCGFHCCPTYLTSNCLTPSHRGSRIRFVLSWAGEQGPVPSPKIAKKSPRIFLPFPLADA